MISIKQYYIYWVEFNSNQILYLFITFLFFTNEIDFVSTSMRNYKINISDFYLFIHSGDQFYELKSSRLELSKSKSWQLIFLDWDLSLNQILEMERIGLTECSF